MRSRAYGGKMTKTDRKERQDGSKDNRTYRAFGPYRLAGGPLRLTSHVQLQLLSLIHISYVRFASVYREFKDVNTFMEELGKLLKK